MEAADATLPPTRPLFPEVLFDVVTQHHVQEMDGRRRIVAWADSGDGFVIFERTELRSLVRERLGEEGDDDSTVGVRDGEHADGANDGTANGGIRVRALEYDSFWRENLESYGFVWNDRAPVGWYVRHRDSLFQRGNIHAARTIRFEDEVTRRLRDTGNLQVSVPLLGRYIRAGMFEEALRRFDTHRYEVKLLPVVPYNIVYEIADDEDVPLLLVQRLIEADCGKAMFVDSNPLGQMLFHRMACTELTDPRRNMVLELLLDRHFHIVYEKDGLGNTVLDEFASAWDAVWDGGERGRAGAISGGNNDNDDDDDGSSDDDSEDREKRQLQEDLRTALDTAKTKRDISHRLRLLFDRYVIFLQASTRSLMNSRPYRNSRLVAPHPSKTHSFSNFRSASLRPNENNQELDDGLWRRWSVFMDAVHCQCRVSSSFFQLARRFAPRSEGWIKDLSGRVPLATIVVNAAACSSGPEIPQGIASIVRSCPGTAAVCDDRGRFPLHTALDCGLRWEDGVDDIFGDFPDAIQLSDPSSGFFPFMVAALTGSKGSSSPDGTTIYQLLRQCPSVLSAYHASGGRGTYGNVGETPETLAGSPRTRRLKQENEDAADIPRFSLNRVRRAAEFHDDEEVHPGQCPKKRHKGEESADELDEEMAENQDFDEAKKEETVPKTKKEDSIGKGWMIVTTEEDESLPEASKFPSEENEERRCRHDSSEFELFFNEERDKILDVIPEFDWVFEEEDVTLTSVCNGATNSRDENDILRKQLHSIIVERWNNADPAVVEDFQRRAQRLQKKEISRSTVDLSQGPGGDEGGGKEPLPKAVSNSSVSLFSALPVLEATCSSVVLENEDMMAEDSAETALATIVKRLQNNENVPCVLLDGTDLQKPAQRDLKTGVRNRQLLPPLLQALKNTVAVRHLSLVGCRIGDSEVQQLSEALTASGVNSLNLSRNRISGTGLKRLSTFLRSPKTRVKCMDLSWNHIIGYSEGLSALAHSIGSVGTADELLVGPSCVSVAGNRLGHEGAMTIATALQRLGAASPSLTTLDVSNTNMSVAAAEAFARAQVFLPMLVQLDISDNSPLMNQPVLESVAYCNRARLEALGMCDYDDDDDDLLSEVQYGNDEDDMEIDHDESDANIETRCGFAYSQIERIRCSVDSALSVAQRQATPLSLVFRDDTVIEMSNDSDYEPGNSKEPQPHERAMRKSGIGRQWWREYIRTIAGRLLHPLHLTESSDTHRIFHPSHPNLVLKHSWHGQFKNYDRGPNVGREMFGDPVLSTQHADTASKLLLVVRIPQRGETYEFRCLPVMRPSSEEHLLSSKVGMFNKKFALPSMNGYYRQIQQESSAER